MPIAITNNAIIWYGGQPHTAPATNPGGPIGPSFAQNTQFGPLSPIRGVVSGSPGGAGGNLQAVSFQASPQGWSIGPGYLWATEYSSSIGDEPYEHADTRLYHFGGLSSPSNPAGYGSDGVNMIPLASPATITILGSMYGSNAPQGANGTATSGSYGYATKGGSGSFYPYYNASYATPSVWHKMPFSDTTPKTVSTANIIGISLPTAPIYFDGRMGSAPDKAHHTYGYANTPVPVTTAMPTPSFAPGMRYTVFPYASETPTVIGTSLNLPQWISAANSATNGWYYRGSSKFSIYTAGDNSIHSGGGSAIRQTVWGQAGFIKFPTASVNTISLHATLSPTTRTPDNRGIYSGYGVGQDNAGDTVFVGGGLYSPSPNTTQGVQWSFFKYPVSSATTINTPAFDTYRPTAPTPVTPSAPKTSAAVDGLFGGAPNPSNVWSGDSKLFMMSGYVNNTTPIRYIPTVSPFGSFANTWAQTPGPLTRKSGKAFGV
jgi:hypothetical protein